MCRPLSNNCSFCHLPSAGRSHPFWTSLSQVISGTQTMSVRKFYNGLGQLIQAQSANAELASGARDVVVDTYYDAAGRAYRQSVPYEVVTGSGFHTQDAGQAYTQTAYDALGRATSVTGPDLSAQTTSYAIPYNGGQPYYETCVTDPASRTTCSRQDAWGRTTEVHPPAGPWTQYAYTEQDLLMYVYQKDGSTTFATTTLNYDRAGRKTSMSDPDMGAWSYSYNALGSLTGQADARGCVTSLSYDLLNRLSGKSYSGAGCGASTGAVSYSYDGVTTRRVEGEAYSSQSGSTGADYKTPASNGQVLGSNWGATSGSYALYNNLSFGESGQNTYLMLVYANGSASNSTVQVLVDGVSKGSLTGKPTGGWGQASAQLQTVILNLGQVAAGTHSLKLQVNANGQNIDIDYFVLSSGWVGQRRGTADGSGSTSWLYDDRGRLTQESKSITGGGTYVTQWEYNSADMLTRMIYPDGEAVTYSYHRQGALNSLVSSLGETFVYSTAYDAAGRIDLQKLGGASALQLDYSYFDWDTVNGAGRLKQITAGTSGSPASLLDLRYYNTNGTPVYDAAGNLLNIYDYKMGSPQTQSFGYDQLNRLTSAAASGGMGGNYSESYSYDSRGRLSSKGAYGTYNYQDSAHVHAVTSHTGGSYTYNANGSQVTRSLGADTYNLYYDAESRMVEISKNSIVQYDFLYDGSGVRVKSMRSGQTTYFVGNYYEISGSAATKYYYLGSQRVALRTSAGVRYLFGDHLGSTSVSADVNGGNVTRQLYKGWGEIRYSTNPGLPAKYQYTGQYSYASGATADFGLLYYNARFYDPALGRFTQADTIVPGAGNPAAWDRFAGMLNNPTNSIDPTGNKTCKIADDAGKCVLWDTSPKIAPSKNTVIIRDVGCFYVCHLVQNRTLHVTWYYTPVESEFNSGETVTVNVGKETLILDRQAVLGGDGMRVQGSLQVGNRYINSLKENVDHTYSASWGFGNLNLVPFTTGAVGPTSRGIYYYLPHFETNDYNGIFHGVDRGGDIKNGDLDIYIGVGYSARKKAAKTWQDFIQSGVFGDDGASNFSYYECEKKALPPISFPKEN